MQKTTLIAILTAIGTLAGVAAQYLGGHGLDVTTVSTAVLGLLAALGFYHAADSPKA
jgi:hypothetical protein